MTAFDPDFRTKLRELIIWRRDVRRFRADIAPPLGIAILQPDKCSADVWWAMLGVVNNDRLFAPGWHEDFHCSVVIAVGALVQRALDALVCL